MLDVICTTIYWNLTHLLSFRPNKTVNGRTNPEICQTFSQPLSISGVKFFKNNGKHTEIELRAKQTKSLSLWKLDEGGAYILMKNEVGVLDADEVIYWQRAIFENNGKPIWKTNTGTQVSAPPLAVEAASFIEEETSWNPMPFSFGFLVTVRSTAGRRGRIDF